MKAMQFKAYGDLGQWADSLALAMSLTSSSFTARLRNGGMFEQDLYLLRFSPRKAS